MKLDRRPKLWEDRTTLFLAFMIDQGAQSSTIKSYLSAIKSILVTDKYKWDDSLVMITSLTQACKLINDRVTIRLPIRKRPLDLILYEIERLYVKQFYLCTMYKALFSLGYYGMFRIGELRMSEHVVKTANVYRGTNKNKILIILYSSKTHDLSKRPQKIKISANEPVGQTGNRIFCPFALLTKYFKLRGNYRNVQDPLFIFRDQKPVTGNHVRKVLQYALKALNIDHTLYGFHSLRIGHSSELLKAGVDIEVIKLKGR